MHLVQSYQYLVLFLNRLDTVVLEFQNTHFLIPQSVLDPFIQF